MLKKLQQTYNLDISKFEKYRSNVGGITVKNLSNINEDDCIQAG